LIHLDPADESREGSLEVLHTPGHTTDSIALIDRTAKTVYVGDTLYPFTAVHLDCIGSSMSDCLMSLDRLKEATSGTDMKLSCGHVEASLDLDAIDEFKAMLEAIRAGALQPTLVEDDHGEFTNGLRFSVWAPLKEGAAARNGCCGGGQKKRPHTEVGSGGEGGV